MKERLAPYPSMKESRVAWMGPIPDHWELRRLRHVADLRVSNVNKKIVPGEASVRLCNYVDVYKHDVIRSSMALMRASATPDEISRFRLQAGDVIITKDSEDWKDIGVPAWVADGAEDIICGYHLAILRSDRSVMLGRYLHWQLQSQPTQVQFRVAANGVTRYGLSHGAIKEVVIAVPPIPEQSAIVHFLNNTDRRIRRLITTKQRLIALLEEQKQIFTHMAVTRGIDPSVRLKPSGIAWLGDVPEHWQVRRIKNVLQIADHRSSTGRERLLSMRMYHGLVPFAEHYSRPPQSTTLVGFKIVTPGQIVINRMQAGNGLIFASGLDGLVSPDYSVFDVSPTVNPEYLAALFRSHLVRAKFRAESKGLGTGSSGFLRLYDDRLGAIHIALPGRVEQDAILKTADRELTGLNSSIASAKNAIRLLNEYRASLIRDLVTGKVDVRLRAAGLTDAIEDEAELSEGQDIGDDDEELNSAGDDALDEVPLA